jgi:hypothetical protein
MHYVLFASQPHITPDDRRDPAQAAIAAGLHSLSSLTSRCAIEATPAPDGEKRVTPSPSSINRA